MKGRCELMEEASRCGAEAVGMAFSRSILVSLQKKSEMLSHYLSLEPARRVSINRLVAFDIQDQAGKEKKKGGGCGF